MFSKFQDGAAGSEVHTHMWQLGMSNSNHKWFGLESLLGTRYICQMDRHCLRGSHRIKNIPRSWHHCKSRTPGRLQEFSSCNVIEFSEIELLAAPNTAIWQFYGEKQISSQHLALAKCVSYTLWCFLCLFIIPPIQWFVIGFEIHLWFDLKLPIPCYNTRSFNAFHCQN